MKNLDCTYYPCHFKGQTCKYCYCPFYPCMEISTGGKFKKVFLDMRLMHHEKVIWKDGQNIEWDIWDCSQCDWIHKIEIENKIAIDPIM